MVELIGQGTVMLEWQADAPIFTDAQVAQVEAFWEQRPPTVFNGSLLIHRQTLVSDNHIRLTGTFTEYKFYFAQRHGMELGLTTIGVSGLIILNEQVIFARRSPHMTGYPNMLELVPSGTIDNAVALANGTVDFVTKIKQEFEEEVGLPQHCIQKVTPFAVTYDSHDSSYDILCRLDVETTLDAILTGLKQSDEYTEPIPVPLDQVEAWLTVHQQEVLPTSHMIVSLLG